MYAFLSLYNLAELTKQCRIGDRSRIFGKCVLGNKGVFDCFMLVCVVLWCLFLVALLSPAGKRDALLAIVFVVFCHFPKCVLVHIRIKGDIDAIKLVKALQ